MQIYTCTYTQIEVQTNTPPPHTYTPKKHSPILEDTQQLTHIHSAYLHKKQVSIPYPLLTTAKEADSTNVYVAISRISP